MSFLTSAFEQQAAMVCPDRNYLSQNSDVSTRRGGTPEPNIPQWFMLYEFGRSCLINLQKKYKQKK